MTNAPIAPTHIVAAMNEHGTFTWAEIDGILTEVDPFFITSYGYQDQSGPDGPKHFVWMAVAGAGQVLTHSAQTRDAAMSIIGRIRLVKKRH